MVREHYLAIPIFLIIASLISTAVGNSTSPYSIDFDLRDMSGFSDGVISADDIKAFIQEKASESPMLSEADVGSCFISAGQTNNVNPAFLVATAYLEGGFGTLGWAQSHQDCHNTFGYGIPSGSTQPDDYNCMDSWCGMIQRVASVIAHGSNYYSQGRYTVSQVRSKYAASPNPDSIASLMNELYTFSVNPTAASSQANNQEFNQQESSGIQASGITEFKWVGVDADKVGTWDNGNPDENLDGHFFLNLYLPYPTEIKSVLIYSSDENGNPSGGQFWDTADNSHWILCAFDKGDQLNKNHIPSLGTFSGQVQFDLYGADSGWFKPGNRFGIVVALGDFQKLTSIPLA